MILPVFSERQKNNWLSEYLKFDIDNLENELKNRDNNFWEKLGRTNALKQFHFTAARVPAYKDFLKKNKIDSSKIKTINDFNQVPTTDKANYIQTYSLKERSIDGKLDSAKIIASSSGTTGNPNYWPRNNFQELEAAITHELLFKKLFNIHKESTLGIIGFPMGVYVSGIATTLPSYLVSQKYNMSLITAGNNKNEVLKAVGSLSKNFGQILLVGHPFFIKDILETGNKQNIKWSESKINIMFCSEGFNEEWRNYLVTSNNLKSAKIFNTYGCSEMLLMAYETELSINFRKQISLEEPEAPNIFQYNPALRFIQQYNEELIFTSFSGLPLIRFNLHDTGKIYSYEHVNKVVKNKSSLKNSWKLPFVSVSGRSDHAIIFYAANIYPQHIRSALSNSQLHKKLTGKFTMSKGYYKNMDEYLEIHIELKENEKHDKSLEKFIQKCVIEKLKSINSEYNYIWNNLNKDLRPKIKLWKYNSDKYFKLGIKPKYIA